MKLVRFLLNGREQYGEVDGDMVQPLEGSFGAFRPAAGKAKVELSTLHLLAPVSPSKVVAVGPNYRSVCEEMGLKVPEQPGVFLKPSGTVINPEDPILFPPQLPAINYEGELAVVIGRNARSVPRDRAMDHVLGYTCANDVTGGDLKTLGRSPLMTYCKAFDTFAPLGPVLVTDLDPSDLALETRLNGETRQKTNTGDLLFKIDYLISFLSRILTLYAGDVISTGSPAGVKPMKPGDVVEVEIKGIGVLRNPVIAGE